MTSDVETSFVKWDPKFEIGIQIIDEQHKHLVKLCADLYSAIMNMNNLSMARNWQACLRTALKDCCGYVQEHFSAEEKLMKAASYPNFDAHKKMHDDFTKTVLDTAKRYGTWQIKDGLEFVHFLYDWILSHIAHVDKLYIKDLREYLASKH